MSLKAYSLIKGYRALWKEGGRGDAVLRPLFRARALAWGWKHPELPSALN